MTIDQSVDCLTGSISKLLTDRVYSSKLHILGVLDVKLAILCLGKDYPRYPKNRVTSYSTGNPVTDIFEKLHIEAFILLCACGTFFGINTGEKTEPFGK